MHKHVVLLCLLGSAVLTSAYRENTSWVPATKLTSLLSRRDVALVPVSEPKPIWHYYNLDGEDYNAYTFELWNDLFDYVMLEDMEPYIQVTCMPNSSPDIDRTVIIDFNTDDRSEDLFERAKADWEKDDRLFVAHDASCGDLDERQIFSAVSKEFNEAERIIKIEGVSLELSTAEAATHVDVRFGRVDHIVPRHTWAIVSKPGISRRDPGLWDNMKEGLKHVADKVVDTAKDFIHDPKATLKKGVEHAKKCAKDPAACIEHVADELAEHFPLGGTHDVDWHPEWDYRESMVNLSGILPDGLLELNCVGCRANIDLEAEWKLRFTFRPKKFFEDPLDFDNWIQTVLREASVAVRTVKQNDFRIQFELLAGMGIDFWCNFPGTCGFTLHFAGAALQDEGKFKHSKWKEGDPKVGPSVDYPKAVNEKGEKNREGSKITKPTILHHPDWDQRKTDRAQLKADRAALKAAKAKPGSTHKGVPHKLGKASSNSGLAKAGAKAGAKSAFSSFGRSGKQLGSFPLKLGKMALAAPDIGAGFWTDISLDGKLNITSPSFAMKIPAGQEISIDLLRQDKVQNTMKPEFDIGRPHLEISGLALGFSGSLKIGGSLGIGASWLSEGQIGLGCRLDIARLNFKIAEKENVAEGNGCEPGALAQAVSLSLNFQAGLIAWVNAATLFFHTGQLPFPLYATVPIWERCFKCPKDRCLSGWINYGLEKAMNKILGVDDDDLFSINGTDPIPRPDFDRKVPANPLSSSPHYQELFESSYPESVNNLKDAEMVEVD